MHKPEITPLRISTTSGRHQRRIGARHIRPQQITAFPSTCLAQFLPVQLEAERIGRDRLILVGQLDVDDPPERWPGLFPGRPQLDEQLVAGQLLLAQLMQAFDQLLEPPPAHRLFLVTTCAAAGQDVKLVILFDEFHLNRVTNLRPRPGQEVLLQLAEPSARCAHQIVYGRLRRPHLGQHRLRRDAAVHHQVPRARPYRVSIRLIKSRGVVLSAVLPAITSQASGKPSGVTTKAMTTWTQSERLSRL